MPLLAVNDVHLYYESRGTGAPLVMIGGLGLDVSEMTNFTGPLAEGFQVIAIDNRGTGRSDKPAGPYSIEQMAGDAAGLLDRLGVGRAHMLGFSMGGRIAMSLALSRPELVDRLVLVSTAPRRAPRTRWRVVLGMLTANLPVLRGRYPQPRHAMKAQFDATTRFDCTSRLGEIDAPVLIVAGRTDHVAPLPLAEEMRDKIPGARLMVVDGGHIAPLMIRHKQVVTAVTEFLSADSRALSCTTQVFVS
ncbi:MAG TPA: alpha/beta hydrolase [Trebonia sp.]|nr:alpha/beta hydrolase [Trebonia sp.]